MTGEIEVEGYEFRLGESNRSVVHVAVGAETCTEVVEAFASFLRGAGFIEGNIGDAFRAAAESSDERIKVDAEDRAP